MNTITSLFYSSLPNKMSILRAWVLLISLTVALTTAQNATSESEEQQDNETVVGAPEHSIVGGKDIEYGSRPYLLSIGYTLYNVLDIHECAGSLISPHAVLTAAHCMFFNGKWLPLEWVDFFRHDLKNKTGRVRMHVNTTQCEGDIVYHPDYDIDLNNDVAIIFLPQPIYNITPVVLNSDKRVPIEGDPLDVAGWGATEQGGDLKKIVAKSITVDYLPNDSCTSKPFRNPDHLVTDTMMCAFSVGKDHCYGDSGTLLNCSEKIL